VFFTCLPVSAVERKLELDEPEQAQPGLVPARKEAQASEDLHQEQVRHRHGLGELDLFLD